MEKNIFGKAGEIVATQYLKKQKYKILERNYKNTIGEIDIIAKKKGVIIFVEVKTRLSSAFGDPLEAIDDIKQMKIRNVASMYLKSKGLLDSPCRFDAISVLGTIDDPEIRHIEDAF